MSELFDPFDTKDIRWELGQDTSTPTSGESREYVRDAENRIVDVRHTPIVKQEWVMTDEDGKEIELSKENI